jgi:hypothetical protein
MGEHDDSPSLRYFLLCRQFNENPDGSLNFFGLLKIIWVSGPDEELPPIELNLIAAIGLYLQDESKSHDVYLTMETPNGEGEFIGEEYQLGNVGNRFIDSLTLPVKLIFSRTGTYYFRAYYKDRLFAEYPFEVRRK